MKKKTVKKRLKVPSDYPQLAFRIGEEDKREINILVDNLCFIEGISKSKIYAKALLLGLSIMEQRSEE